MALSLDGTTGISASGNIWGNNINVPGTLTVGNFSPSSFSAPGNVTGGNILTAGLISATGNIVGNYILGNGSQLTGVDATQIINGTSNAKVVSSGGNIAVGIGGTANVTVFATTGAFVTGVASASGNVTGGNLFTGGTVSATGNVQGGNLITAGLISATGPITGAALTGTSLAVSTGNITGGNLLLSGAIVDSAQLDIQTSANNANIALAPNGTGIVTVSTQISAAGNVTGANIRTGGSISATGAITGTAITGTSLTVSTGNVTCGNIVNANGNGVGNIGSSSLYFNTAFIKATSAQYADLAEKYVADAAYQPGTVLIFGGEKEVTMSTEFDDTRVAGVVSTNPSYLMNAAQSGVHVVEVALQGRVPCKVRGPVTKGDLMVSGDSGHAYANNQARAGTIIGKSLQNFAGELGTIEIAIGRD